MEAQFVQRLMEHRSMLHSFVFAIARDPHLTEDILQEVSVVLWSKFSEFKPGTDFGAWARSDSTSPLSSSHSSTNRSAAARSDRMEAQSRSSSSGEMDFSK